MIIIRLWAYWCIARDMCPEQHIRACMLTVTSYNLRQRMYSIIQCKYSVAGSRGKGGKEERRKRYYEYIHLVIQPCWRLYCPCTEGFTVALITPMYVCWEVYIRYLSNFKYLSMQALQSIDVAWSYASKLGCAKKFMQQRILWCEIQLMVGIYPVSTSSYHDCKLIDIAATTRIPNSLFRIRTEKIEVATTFISYYCTLYVQLADTATSQAVFSTEEPVCRVITGKRSGEASW